MWLNFIFALIPIIWLIVSLGVIKMSADKACTIGLVLAIILAVTAFKMPVQDSLTGALEGIVMAIWPIVYVILAALFTYNLTTASGAMKVIQDMLSSITTDRRILVLIIAWGFGGFLEAIAGFGTAVAIPAGILIAFGVEPIRASVICLIANTTPTAFGAIGLPVITLANVTHLDTPHLSFIVTMQLLPLIILIPFVLVAMVGGGTKAIKGVGLTTLLSGVAFAVPQVFVAKFVGAELPAIVGSVVCIAVTVLMARVQGKNDPEALKHIPQHSSTELLKAWAPFILVFIIVLLASPLVKPINAALAKVVTQIPIYTGPKAVPYTINWLSSPGTLIILATFIGGLIQGMSVSKILGVLGTTAKKIWRTLITVCAIVALAKVMGYSGMTTSLAVTLVAIMGPVYPLVAPVIGALGTFITGSDTSSNVLFGNLQLQAATTLKANSFWVVGANMVGATAGKMISPQSIAVAAAATNQEGDEGNILKEALKWCGAYLVIICLYIYVTGLLLHFI
ncbi:L-lactate permease [Agrilactobacillus fermenti]|uniref:L-lactate permease n=1 Tax=Agrilactobacillus fermenti TaxID=2586909 RepID=UPI001E353DDF|nr:L-lactate permease [Agrilactobacillus fermenti]MCD2256341.1 L-lactate permease [Agrilactobacillus fermenti]